VRKSLAPGRYALEHSLHNGRPVYRRISYFPPTAGSNVNGSVPPPPGGGEGGLLLFLSDGNWVVAPERMLVMDTTDFRRARLMAFSDAAFPHQVGAAQWREVFECVSCDTTPSHV